MKHTWKRFLSVALSLMLLVSCLALGGFADNLVAISAEQYATTQKPEKADDLKFNAEGKFKIVQISDLQEYFLTSTMTKDYLRWIAETEKPDLFILTGDNISAGDSGLQSLNRKLVSRSIDSYMSVFEDIGIPVTMVLGNHDVESSGITRWQQMQTYQDYECFVGFSAEGADESAGVSHWGTHNLLIKDSAGAENVFALWMFDSGDYVWLEDGTKNGYNNVAKTAVDWFKAQPEKALPGLSFQHIIVAEIWDYLDRESTTTMVEKLDEDGKVVLDDDGKPVMVPKMVKELDIEGKEVLDRDGNPVMIEEVITTYSLPEGTVGEMNENPCPSKYNNGQFAALKGTGVQAMFFGHDHTNTFELETEAGAPMLINSPCSGFGSYGRKDLRGVRVIELDEEDLTTFDTRLVSYEDFAEAAGPITSTLEDWRLSMMNNGGSGGTGWVVVDWILFKPLIWVLRLFTL